MFKYTLELKNLIAASSVVLEKPCNTQAAYFWPKCNYWSVFHCYSLII